MTSQNSNPQNSKKRAPKNGGKAAMKGCVFFEFWGVEFRFLIIFSEEFAKLSLILARDNNNENGSPRISIP